MKAILRKILSAFSKRNLTVAGIGVLLVAAAFGAGYLLRGRQPRAEPTAGGPAAAAAEQPAAPAKTPKVQIWTCAMHPQIRLPKPGKCPICYMDLIPVPDNEGEEGADADSLRRFTTSPAAAKLMDIQTSPVERKFVSAEVRMVGKVDYDETKLAYITAWVGGRLDRLYVDYTGIPVRKGDHMVYLYSPDLYAAQQELLQALKVVKEMEKSSLEEMKATTRATVEAVREKLRLLGLTRDQVAEIETRGSPIDHLTIYAPAAGIVIHKDAQEGMYVQTGTRIYTIADLREVWVKLDAYESDLQWLRYGQKVSFASEAYPGDVFTGRIAFIDPVLNSQTRTVKVRVNVPNEDGRLKPEMFVRATVNSLVAAGGRVMAPDLAGKWICRMHPEVIQDKPGDCPICGMPLVRTESMGYVPVNEAEAAQPLVVPATAPLITGRRAVVYLQVPDAPKPTFTGREIVLGARAGDYYIVRDGLKEGDLVVTHGNFKIDSALQIMARPSMMTPEGGGGGGMAGMAHDHGGAMPKAAGEAQSKTMAVPSAFGAQLRGVQAAYATVAGAVKTGDLEQVRAAYKGFVEVLDRTDATPLAGPMRALWDELAMRLHNDGIIGGDLKTHEEVAEEFATFEKHVTRLQEQFGMARMPAAVEKLTVPAAFRGQLGKVLDAYLALQAALAGDDQKAAAEAVAKTGQALDAADMKLLAHDAHMAWMRELPSLRDALAQAQKAEKITDLRAAFSLLSDELAVILRAFGPLPGRPVYVLECPMAFNNRGARWLQADKETRNPYFGAAMPACGTVVETIGVEGRGSRVE